MICKSCNKDAKYGYFWTDQEGECNYICTGCLADYDKFRRIIPKYDHEAIYQMYLRGLKQGLTKQQITNAIAKHFGTNPLTITSIVMRQERDAVIRA